MEVVIPLFSEVRPIGGAWGWTSDRANRIRNAQDVPLSYPAFYTMKRTAQLYLVIVSIVGSGIFFILHLGQSTFLPRFAALDRSRRGRLLRSQPTLATLRFLLPWSLTCGRVQEPIR